MSDVSEDFTTDNLIVSVKGRWSVAAVDWRAVYGSLGIRSDPLGQRFEERWYRAYLEAYDTAAAERARNA